MECKFHTHMWKALTEHFAEPAGTSEKWNADKVCTKRQNTRPPSIGIGGPTFTTQHEVNVQLELRDPFDFSRNTVHCLPEPWKNWPDHIIIVPSHSPLRDRESTPRGDQAPAGTVAGAPRSRRAVVSSSSLLWRTVLLIWSMTFWISREIRWQAIIVAFTCLPNKPQKRKQVWTTEHTRRHGLQKNCEQMTIPQLVCTHETHVDVLQLCGWQPDPYQSLQGIEKSTSTSPNELN